MMTERAVELRRIRMVPSLTAGQVEPFLAVIPEPTAVRIYIDGGAFESVMQPALDELSQRLGFPSQVGIDIDPAITFTLINGTKADIVRLLKEAAALKEKFDQFRGRLYRHEISDEERDREDPYGSDKIHAGFSGADWIIDHSTRIELTSTQVNIVYRGQEPPAVTAIRHTAYPLLAPVSINGQIL